MSKTPHELWLEAKGDRERYLIQMRFHGYLTERCPHVNRDQERCDRNDGHSGLHTYGHDIFGHGKDE